MGTEQPMLTEEPPGIEATFCMIASSHTNDKLWRGIGDLGLWNIEAEMRPNEGTNVSGMYRAEGTFVSR
jgi:hypothetical protein